MTTAQLLRHDAYPAAGLTARLNHDSTVTLFLMGTRVGTYKTAATLQTAIAKWRDRAAADAFKGEKRHALRRTLADGRHGRRLSIIWSPLVVGQYVEGCSISPDFMNEFGGVYDGQGTNDDGVLCHYFTGGFVGVKKKHVHSIPVAQLIALESLLA